MRHATLDEPQALRDDVPHTRPPGHAAAALRAELRHAMARAAAVWRDCGVEPGESVAVALANPAESLVACLGVAEAGGFAVIVDPASSPEEIGRLQSRGGWRFILAESRESQPVAVRDFVLTRAEWRRALEAARAPGESPATIAG
jgi:acyl-CoA synthetase (AMP-forming)/AMP-acid ligase II